VTVRVLVVDDDEDILALLEIWLDSPGLEVVAAARTGEEAVEKVEALDPDVVLLDVRLPPHDGFEVGARIRELRPDQRLVLYSGVVDENVRERARAAGFSDCVAKDDYERLPQVIAAAARK
jgi:CheY-like chemotaxis protein